MPQGDRTGPTGQGARTGRGIGFCAGNDSPGFMNGGFGRGMRRGFNRGRGFEYRGRAIRPILTQQVQPAVITEKQEKQFLEQELSALEEETKEIEERLKELKK